MVLEVHQHLSCAEAKAWKNIFEIWIEGDVAIMKSPYSHGPMAFVHVCPWCLQPLSKLE